MIDISLIQINEKVVQGNLNIAQNFLKKAGKKAKISLLSTRIIIAIKCSCFNLLDPGEFYSLFWKSSFSELKKKLELKVFAIFQFDIF